MPGLIPFRRLDGLPVTAVPQIRQLFGEPFPPTGAATLDRALRAAQDRSGLDHGVALKIDEEDGITLVFGELGEGIEDGKLGLSLTEVIAQVGYGRLIRQRNGRPGGAASNPIQACIDHDAMQPGGDGGVTAELVSATKCGNQGILQGILSVLRIARGSQRNGPKPVTVPLDQRGEGGLIPRNMGSEQLVVFHQPRMTMSAMPPW